jgi:hypothetical protein
MKHLALIAIVVFGLSQQPTKPPEGKDDPAKGGSVRVTDHASADKDNKPTVQAPPAPDNEELKTQEDLARFTKALVIVSFLQFAALIVQAGLFFRQTRIMDQHRVHLEKLAIAASDNAIAAKEGAEAANKNAEFSKLNAEATEKSADAAKASADAALLNARAVINSERPWMIIELTPIPGVPKEGYVVFRAWNRGRTPAEILAYQGNFFYHGHDEQFKPDPTFKPLETRYRVCISPGNSIEIYGFSLTGSLPPDHWEWMQKERKYMYFYGNIVYRDLISNEEHESRFCYWLSPAPGVGLIMGGDRNWNKYT